MRKLHAIWLAIALSGCMMFDAGYTDNDDVRKFSIPSEEKIAITYSVSVDLERGDIFAAPTVAEVSGLVSDALNKSGVFSRVCGVSQKNDRGYHVELSLKQSGMSIEQSMGVGMLAGYTLLLVPTAEVITFDVTATLYLKGKPIYATAKAEEMRCIIWLPMAPIGMFMNSWTVVDAIEKGSVNSAINDIVQEHNRRYLSNVNVVEIIKR